MAGESRVSDRQTGRTMEEILHLVTEAMAGLQQVVAAQEDRAPTSTREAMEALQLRVERAEEADLARRREAQRLQEKVDALEARLDGSAGQGALERVESRVQQLEASLQRTLGVFFPRVEALVARMEMGRAAPEEQPAAPTEIDGVSSSSPSSTFPSSRFAASSASTASASSRSPVGSSTVSSAVSPSSRSTVSSSTVYASNRSPAGSSTVPSVVSPTSRSTAPSSTVYASNQSPVRSSTVSSIVSPTSHSTASSYSTVSVSRLSPAGSSTAISHSNLPTTERVPAASPMESSSSRTIPLPITPALCLTMAGDLLSAAEQGKVDDVRRLLDAGADVNVAINRDSPLILAAIKAHFGTVALLLKRGADVQARGSWGRTPLHFSAVNDRSGSCLALLIDAGAEVDSVDVFGQTPLYWAASVDNKAAVRTLVAAGACKATENKDRRRPFDVASSDGVRKLLR